MSQRRPASATQESSLRYSTTLIDDLLNTLNLEKASNASDYCTSVLPMVGCTSGGDHWMREGSLTG